MSTETAHHPISSFFAAAKRRPIAYDTLHSSLVNLQAYLNGQPVSSDTHSTECEQLLDFLATEAFVSHTLTSTGGSLESSVIQVKLLKALQALCDSSVHRLQFAQKWLTAALNFLRKSVHVDERLTPENEKIVDKPYFLARGCCEILTRVVESSGTHSYFIDLGALAWCVRYSSDIFLSVKCCEIIFRVSRVHPSALRSAHDILSVDTVNALDRLLSTRKLPSDVCDVIQRIQSVDGSLSSVRSTHNAALCVINTSEISMPPILRAQGELVGEEQRFRHESPDGGLMQTFFGKQMVVLDWVNRPDLTVPYTCIKTMKLNRHKQLVIQLKEIPYTLRGIYQDLYNRIQITPGFQLDSAVPLVSQEGLPALLSQHDEMTISSPPEIIISTTHEEYRKMRETKIQSWITSALIAAKKAPVDSYQETLENTYSTISTNSSSQIPPTESEPSSTRDDPNVFNVDLSQWYPTKPVQKEASEKPLVSLQNSTSQSQPVIQTKSVSYHGEIDPLMLELREMISHSASMSQQEGHKILEEAGAKIQLEIDRFQSTRDGHYRKYTENVNRHVEILSNAHQALQKNMSSLVEKLNVDVRSMAEQNMILQDQLKAAENEGNLAFQEIFSSTQCRISEMEQKATENLHAIGEKTHALVSSTNPLRFMTQFLAETRRSLHE